MERKEQSQREIGPVHPGEHLAEYLEELDVSQYRLAKEIHVPQMRVSEIVRGRRAITADTALRFARFFGTSAQFWLNLQAQYDLETAEQALGPSLEEILEYRSSDHQGA
jgi:addiction module HigA family antidote